MGLQPTPTTNRLPLHSGDFPNLAAALDYAAQGDTGCNFYNGKGDLYAVLPYSELRDQARAFARRLTGLDLVRGARVAIVAETGPDFLRSFFACQYAGLTPVPLPVPLHLASRSAYVDQLRGLLLSCRPAVALAPASFVPFLTQAAEGLSLAFLGSPEAFVEEVPEGTERLNPLQAEETAYLQYTSGSTRFPRGVVVSQQALMDNLAGSIRYGVVINDHDRCVSWLPYYHDMGLVGFVLAPVASQRSVDYLSTRDFAMRPRLWLRILSESGGTVSFSPTFGYELCVRRLGNEDAAGFDLRAWRVAGVGAEKIRPEPLDQFAERLGGSGFDRNAFMACYGMAECSLAVSFAPVGTGLGVDRVDANYLADTQEALPVTSANAGETREAAFVNCGSPLPGYEVAIKGAQGEDLPERQCGLIHVRGPSVMSGYFEDPEATAEVLTEDGWLNTGDIGYRLGDSLLITGRAKDVIIINGRNFLPQDLEYLAEQISDVRSGDASAFSVTADDGNEKAVMVVQCRRADASGRDALIQELQRLIHEELGIDCHIDLVAPRTLPRTSSGKLSRSRTREDFLSRVERGLAQFPASPRAPLRDADAG